ncbi:MAG TPA: rRNA maturation RNase YbeY [Candidatus Aquilonibacter sp.]|nr:rRNA maturation RNase YbeY [Candidatus Aquilonibacter sp.]
MIINRQRAIRVPIRTLEKFLARAAKALRLPPDAAAVCFVTNSQITKWNKAYRGKNKPTDVLSFRGGDDSGPKDTLRGRGRRVRDNFSTSAISFPSSICYLGDIAIAPAVARRNAILYGRTFHDELRVLILHGLLHLMGYDHETDTGQMDRREKRLRLILGIS